VNELKPGNIVYLNIKYVGHYNVITGVNDSIVYLADTDLGNINMTYMNFTAAYIQNTVSGCGYALVVINTLSDPQLSNNSTLTREDMKAIKGTGLGAYVYGSNLYAVYVLGWKKENPIIQNLAKGIIKAYKPRIIAQKAHAIFTFVYKYSVKHWENHYNTQRTPNYVLYHHSANCAETARLVYLLAQDMGIPGWRIRYVHNKIAQHYWVQIYCGVSRDTDRYWKYWKDLDCSHAYDNKNINEFGEFIKQTGKYGNPMLKGVREYDVIS
jgi:Transglutaminase-like superfamily.